MNILLFGGFLGSGKTSLILPVAKFLAEGIRSEAGAEPGSGTAPELNPQNPSLVIIENEVGETGIDDKVLKADGLSVRELFSGCICCTLTTELTVTLNEIHETIDPQWVIIEATGMAYPHKIAETIRTYGKGLDSLKIIVVADAERWEELTEVVPGLVEGQIANADVIFLNKIDCLEPGPLAEVEESLRKMNLSALLYPVSTFKGIEPEIWRKAVLAK